jgi:uncharacterized coiled-coil protein SlyX
MVSDREVVIGRTLLRVFAIGAMLVLTSCRPPAAERADQTLRIQQLERDLAKRDAQITALKELLLEDRLNPKQEAATVAKAIEDLKTANEAQTESVTPPPSQYPSMCYKEYCPCKPPQGGPDKDLCRQLEQGQDPAVELMIAGRKLREERLQITSRNEEGE